MSACRLSLWSLLLSVVLLFCLSHAVTAADSSSSSSSGSNGNGGSTTSTQDLCTLPGYQFNAQSPPTSQRDLAFCKEYNANSISERCKQLTSIIACSPCHPEVGTEQRVGVCEPLCNEWYYACMSALFSSAEGMLTPCSESSLVCAPLGEIVHSGRMYCERSGFQVSPPLDSSVSPRDEILSMLSGNDPTQTACFDGTVPRKYVPTTYMGDEKESSVESESESETVDVEAGSPRFYKTSEEVAELQRQRDEREKRQAQQQYTDLLKPVIKYLTSLSKRWHRFLRTLPSPIQQYLDYGFVPFGVSLLLMFYALKCMRIFRPAPASHVSVRDLRADALSRRLEAEVEPEPRTFTQAEIEAKLMQSAGLNFNVSNTSVNTTIVDGQILRTTQVEEEEESS